MNTMTFYGVGQEFDQAWSVRKAVFVDEQNVPLALERDSVDERSWHVAIIEDDQVVATGRVYQLRGQVYGIGRVAVLKSKRSQGLGREVMLRLIELAWKENAEAVEIHAQTQAVRFYESLGFVATGAPFMEAGIEHKTMVLKRPAHIT